MFVCFCFHQQNWNQNLRNFFFNNTMMKSKRSIFIRWISVSISATQFPHVAHSLKTAEVVRYQTHFQLCTETASKLMVQCRTVAFRQLLTVRHHGTGVGMLLSQSLKGQFTAVLQIYEIRNYLCTYIICL